MVAFASRLSAGSLYFFCLYCSICSFSVEYVVVFSRELCVFTGYRRSPVPPTPSVTSKVDFPPTCLTHNLTVCVVIRPNEK